MPLEIDDWKLRNKIIDRALSVGLINGRRQSDLCLVLRWAEKAGVATLKDLDNHQEGIAFVRAMKIVIDAYNDATPKMKPHDYERAQRAQLRGAIYD